MDLSLEDKISLLEQEITDERARLSSDRMDISFGEIINLYRSSELIIRPEYQRLFRWSNSQKTGLIESILLGIPVPPIFVAEDENGVWELVDGLQRISTIISFFGELKADISSIESDKCESNTDSTEIEEEDSDKIITANYWKLESGSLIQELDGFDINTLPKKYVINLKRAVCRVEILRGESNTAMKYELFKRLNSGGSKLTPQEIRNAIYRGINPTINELLEELINNQNFKLLTGLSNQKKQELYDQELILRFIAFYGNIEEINLNTELYLDTFMETSVKNAEFPVEFYKNLFNRVMEVLGRLKDATIFRSNRNLFVPALFEGITLGIAQEIDYYSSNLEKISEKISILKESPEFRRFSGSSSNSKNRIKNRLSIACKIFEIAKEG
ncbi:GmrSD restriction endonuclease domain-containing protein [Anaerocolumna chitinilytica]|uniref:GmrSD restriction endonucleases N-terminal domain-containing protein n=1 Tax=Anaerocolumna chitinilytica TaxID=1727145 RepID=A0A7I8DTT9_9FIRM|nr:DUF262 domain-containing protein [Anaerocolumna chitinilytica]BCK00735.1 hypothetical protein bsdcttw_37750 [Anaerocolumna chitinilytica]